MTTDHVHPDIEDHFVDVAGAQATTVTGSSAFPIMPGTETRRWHHLGLWVAVCWLILLGALAATAGVLPLHPIDQFTDLGARTPPGPRWPEFLGSDSLGRSVLSRVVFGARQSLLIGLTSVALAASVGTLVGLVAGYFRGKIDEVIGVFVDALLSIPALLLLLAIAAIGSRNLTTIILGIALFLSAPFARLVRAGTMSFAEREFVLAAQAMGARRSRILFREIMPNVVPGIVSVVFLYAATVIVAEGTLSFLGLGVPPPQPSWGGMINDGRSFLDASPALVFVPATMLLVTVVALRRVGDEIRHRVGGGAK